ncbi:MAG TPA: hypothetical protein PKO06_09215, partial [Candidatus Ozemobacteraceae bacterium]|nr:hypothetical protein [Candidatus Ozemobacteraceae bacterium]
MNRRQNNVLTTCLTGAALLFYVGIAGAVNLLTSATMLYLNKAQHSLQTGNIAAARAFFEQARKAAPSDPKILKFEQDFKVAVQKKVAELKREAEFHLRNKNLPKALESYRRILTCEPEHQEAQQKVNELKQDQLIINQYQRTGIVVPESTGRSHDTTIAQFAALPPGA